MIWIDSANPSAADNAASLPTFGGGVTTASYTVPPPPSLPVTPSPTGGITPAVPPPTPSDLAVNDKLIDVMERMFNQPVYLPEPGQPSVIPQATSNSSPIPMLLIVAGLAILGYFIWKRTKGGD